MILEPLKNPSPLTNSSFLGRFFHTRRRLREAHSARCVKGDVVVKGVATIPKVSVMVVTYNHEPYIGEALDSILMQERDFDIEINVIDDCSTDSTQRIVRDYQLRHPEIINCYFNEHNVGYVATQQNTFRGFQTLRGEYFALLEGDDYWTDSKKLKEQVGFLEDHLEYVACAHDTLKVFGDGRAPEHFLPYKAFTRDRATIVDLINMAGVFHLSSIVYRNKFGLNPPQCLVDPYSCEVTINMLYGQFGNFYCIHKYMSAYRVHESGVFSTRSVENIWLFHIHGYRRFALYMGVRYWVLFSRAVIGFSRYVLLAYGRGLSARLKFKSKWIFMAHLLLAGLMFSITKPIDFFINDVGSKHGRERLARHIRGRLAGAYRRVIIMLPDPLIHSYLAVESKIPFIRSFRLRCKRFVQHI